MRRRPGAHQRRPRRAAARTRARADAERRARRPGRLVEVDRPLLERDEEREAGEELRHRRPAQLDVARPVHADLAAGARHAGRRGACAPVVDRFAVRPRREILGLWSRRVISSGSSCEAALSATAAPSSSGDHVYVAGTAPIMPGDADPPASRTSRCAAASRSSSTRSPKPARASSDVVRTRVYITDAATRAGGDARARRGLRRGASGLHRASSCGLLDPRWLVRDRGGGRASR